MTNGSTSGIQHQDKKFLGKISKYFDFFFQLTDGILSIFSCWQTEQVLVLNVLYFFIAFHLCIRSILLFIFVVRLNLMRELPTLYYIIVMLLMYYVMTTMWRALNQRGLRRVYAQSLI